MNQKGGPLRPASQCSDSSDATGRISDPPPCLLGCSVEIAVEHVRICSASQAEITAPPYMAVYVEANTGPPPSVEARSGPHRVQPASSGSDPPAAVPPRRPRSLRPQRLHHPPLSMDAHASAEAADPPQVALACLKPRSEALVGHTTHFRQVAESSLFNREPQRHTLPCGIELCGPSGEALAPTLLRAFGNKPRMFDAHRAIHHATCCCRRCADAPRMRSRARHRAAMISRVEKHWQ